MWDNFSTETTYAGNFSTLLYMLCVWRLRESALSDVEPRLLHTS